MDYRQYLKKIPPDSAPDTAVITDVLESVEKQAGINFINDLKKDFKKILLILPSAGRKQ